MVDVVDIVKRLNHAFETKDATAMRSLLHPQYTFTGSLMTLQGAAEAIAFMSNCPFNARSENVRLFAAGNTVTRIFDWVVQEPFQGTIRMCDVITVKDGRVFSEELFYDSAKFPQEVLESMQAKAEA